ncbi:MAG TPA: cellulose synthase, partial [Actinomycetes bacterium]|nr:cellulose synthase [Actinomycetes bacterium]
MAGAIWTWIAFQRRGAANGLRALGFTLLPAAAWLTGTLEMVVEITGSVTDWATSLVFNVFTWAGVGLAGLAVVLFLVSGIIRDRQLARGQQPGQDRAAPQATDGGAGRRT